MFQFDLDINPKIKVHFIGIGGVSMSGIAHLLHDRGFKVTGSDRGKNPHSKQLEKLGIKIYYEQTKNNLQSIEKPDLIVYTDAILDDNEELIYARTLGVPVVTRGVFLGALMKNYTHSIAISGSHGKSTVTSMISSILYNTKYNPSILLGGDLDSIKGNVLVGDRDYLVTEACEYKANIINYYPSTVIVLNISPDHLDFYKGLDDLIHTFERYMENLNEDANAIINIDDPNTHSLLSHVKGKIHTFGIENKDAKYSAENIKFDEAGRPSFDFIENGEKIFRISLPVIGRFNIYNAMASIVAMLVTEVDKDLIKERIESYKPLHRRMEIVGEYKGASIMTDYGHHPKEIKSTLDALSEHKKNRLVCIFEPHTYSRTKILLHDFEKSFDSADEVIVTEIYAAREHFDPTIHSKDLVKLLVERGVNAKYIKTFEEAKDYIYKTVQKMT